MNAAKVMPVELERFLTYAAALIREYGYTSSTAAQTEGKSSTGELAWLWANEGRVNDLLAKIKIDNADRVLAAETAEWMRKISSVSNSYMNTLANLGKRKALKENEKGYAASAINAYQKRDEPPPAKKNQEPVTDTQVATGPTSVAPVMTKKFYRKPSKPATSSNDTVNFLGKVGEKIYVPVTYVKMHAFMNAYGENYIYNFEDAEGKKLKWFTQKTTIALNIAIGDKFTLIGTVKDHEEYNGYKTTIVTRCEIKK